MQKWQEFKQTAAEFLALGKFAAVCGAALFAVSNYSDTSPYGDFDAAVTIAMPKMLDNGGHITKQQADSIYHMDQEAANVALTIGCGPAGY